MAANYRRLPLNPCTFWCNSCTFRDNCVIIGTSAICFGLANLVGIYFTPSVTHCVTFEKHREEFLSAAVPFPEHSFEHNQFEKDAAAKCDKLMHYYMYTNLAFGALTIIAGIIYLFVVFRRRPYKLTLVCSGLFLICVVLIVLQFGITFQLSGARLYQDAYNLFKSTKLKHPSCGAGIVKCPPQVLHRYYTLHHIASIVGGLLFSLVYLFMAFCAFAYTKHVLYGYDAIVPDYIFKKDLEEPCQETLFATSGAGRYGRERRPLVDGSGLILHREEDWIKFNIAQINKIAAAKAKK